MNPHQRVVSAAPIQFFEGADAAWRGALDAIVRDGSTVPAIRDPLSIGSQFGSEIRPTRELLAAQFGIRCPRQRIISSATRHFNLGHAVAQLFWTLCGRNDVQTISFYHKFGASLSDDGLTLFAGPGARIFATPSGDQFEAALTRLSRDPASRRAVIQLFTPADSTEMHRDISCFLSLQFLVRGGKLHALGLMRSQSTAMVLPHDLFVLLMLQEAAACRLGLELGAYYHWAASLHIYEDENDLAQGILKENICSAVIMPCMPMLKADWRSSLIAAESDIRFRLTENTNAQIDLSRYGIDAYWAGLLAVLVIAARAEHGVPPRESDLAQVLPELRHSI